MPFREELSISKPSISFQDKLAVIKQLSSNSLTQGQLTFEFERKFADYIGVGNAYAVNSGTSALILALKSLGIGKDDEVIVPNFTFAAPANAVLLLGGRPKFVDVNPETFNLEVSDFEKAITRKTKAVIVVHLFGLPAEVIQIADIARRYGLYVIEDAAQSLGAEIDGKKVGGFGDIGCFSFYPTKTITTGEGGMIVSKDSSMLERIGRLRNQGMHSKYEYIEPGYNFRMTEFQSALGISQLCRIDSFIDKRRKIADLYMTKIDKRILLPFTPSKMKHVFNQFTLRVPTTVRDRLVVELKKRGISSQIYYPKTLTEYEVFSRLTHYSTRTKLPSQVLSLPIYPKLSTWQAHRIIREINDAFDQLAEN